MRLTFDLRFGHKPEPERSDERVLTVADSAAAVRHPIELARLLWGRRYDSVRVLRDKRPFSGVQAGARAWGALARARDFELEDPDGARHLGRTWRLAHAIEAFSVAAPRELWRSRLLHRRAGRIAAERFDLPRSAARASSVTYLRSEPSLTWHGAYVGGAATHTTGVIRGLASNGAVVHVFAPERPEGINDIAFTAVPLRRVYHLAHWLTLVEYSEALVRAAIPVSADFVYHRYALGSYAGLGLARALGVPLVLEFNGSEIWTERHWGSGRLPLVGTLTAIEQRNLHDASLIVVVSDALKDQLVEMGISTERVLVNPNGVDVDGLERLREHPVPEWRRRTGRPEAPTVGFIGTFGLWHGVKVLPALIAAVAKQRPDVRWILIGDGPLHGEVRTAIEDAQPAGQVEMTGIVPRARALELLAGCDICVSPHVPNPDGTRFFGSPTKLFEYMGLAKPIVASDLEQIGEVIEHERNGLLCEPGDASAAAAAVLRLLADKPLRARLGAAALEDARKRYSWGAHVRRILDAVTAPSADPAQTATDPAHVS
jgi:glycosyltransferase involved in cell wall biosynthesis